MQTLNRSISANYSGIMEHGACDALNRSHGARGPAPQNSSPAPYFNHTIYLP